MIDTKHDVASFPIEDRIAYATVVGSMAAADDVVSGAELSRVREMCSLLKLTSEQAEHIVAATEKGGAEATERALTRLRTADLKFTLYTDCLALAYADEQVVPEEERALDEVARALGINAEQVAVLREYVEVTRKAATDDASEQELEEIGARMSAKMEAAKIPVSTVAACSTAGLITTGVTAGFAALAAGLGIGTGIGALVGLGVGTMLGVKWLHNRLVSTDNEKRFEFQKQDTSMTLAEGLAEFHSVFQNLKEAKDMSSPEAVDLFAKHDICHVVFGCDNSIENEALVDTWTVFGTDVSIQRYVEYTKVPEAKAVFEETGYMRTLLGSIKATPKLFDVFMRSRDMKKKWPFDGHDAFMARPLGAIREEFGIRVL